MSDAVETAPGPGPDKKWWGLTIPKSAVPWLLSIVSALAVFLSNLEGIMSFVRRHAPGGLVRQFPFTMQISSTKTDGPGVQENPFYREEHIQEGTLIKAVRNQKFGLPALNFRIVNNSTETTIVRELILEVASSQPDNRPVLQWERQLNLADGENALFLENVGWGVALDSKIEEVTATLSPKTGERRESAPFELALGKIATKSRDVSLASLLQDHFQLQKLPDSDRVKLSGTLSYAYIDSSGAKKPVTTPFAVGIMNRRVDHEPMPPAEGENTYQSIQLLQTNAKKYSVVCPVSGSLEPRKSYQFIVTLCSRQSATHDFDVIVALSNGAKIRLGHYRLEFYLPRPYAEAVTEMAAKPNPAAPRFTSIDGSTEDIPGVGSDEDPSEGGDDKPAVATSTYPKDDELPSPAVGPETEEEPTPEVSESKEPESAPVAQVELKALKASYPYGIPVPGRSDVVESPFLSGKYVDVTGFAHNSIVQDPHVRQLFLVP